MASFLLLSSVALLKFKPHSQGLCMTGLAIRFQPITGAVISRNTY